MMNVAQAIAMHIFRQPTGIPGRLGGAIMARTNRRMTRQAIELFDVQPGGKILEIAFGRRVGLHLLAVSAPDGWVAGVDPSQEMVQQARARNTVAIEAGRVALWQGSVERLPFDNATFDKAVSIKSMQVWPDIGGGLREIRRVMRPGGAFCWHARTIADKRKRDWSKC